MKIAVFDLEANGLLDTVTQCWCGTFKSLDGKEIKSFGPSEIQAMLSYMDEHDVLIGHNIIGYDFPMLKKCYGYVYKGKKVDTLIMSRLLNPKRLLPPHAKNKRAGPHGIYAWGVRVGVDKPEHDDWSQFSDAMMHRNKEDVEINWLVYKELLKEAAGKNYKHAFLLTFKLFEHLQEQEEYGWLVDKPYMLGRIDHLQRRIAWIDKVVGPKLPLILEIEELKEKGEYKYVKKPFLKSGAYSAGTELFVQSLGINDDPRPVVGPYSRINFRHVNLDSNAETKDFLLGLGWEPLEWNTNDDGERTSPKMSKDDPFDGIEGKLGRLVALRVQARQRKSIIEGLCSLIREDGRIGSAVANMAVTGRLTHRNIVNIPGAKSFYGKFMRKMFICGDGKVLVSTDSDSCQLRMLAGRMGNKEYTDAIVNGKKEDKTDNHSMTEKVAGLDSRDTAKTVMYCLLFGGGDAKLGKSAKKPGQGKQVREALYGGLTGLGELMEKLTAEWRSTAKRKFNAKFNRMEYFNGSITGLDGRPILVPSEHAILVYLLQSDEAIMMTAAYNRANMLLRKKYEYGRDFGTVCFYHDEFTFECRADIAEDVRRISEESIAWAGRYYNISCPHIGQGKLGKNWYEVH